MPLDLLSTWGKVHRAANHTDSLKAKLGLGEWAEAPFFEDDANRVSIVAKLDPKTGEHVVRVAALPTRALNILAMEFGDAIHNLRSALDHLAWQLAIEHYGGEPPKPRQVFFPVTSTGAEFNKLSCIAHFNAARLKPLRRFQAYNGRDGRMIRTLHNLDIHDKHRLLLDFRLQAREWTPFNVRIVDVSFLGVSAALKGVKVGTQIVRMLLDPTDPNFKVEMHSKLTPLVLVRGRSHPRHPVTFLHYATAAVGHAIDAVEVWPPHLARHP